MSFFFDLPEPALSAPDLAAPVPPPIAVHQRPLGATAMVLKYAPRRLRPESGDQAIANAQADARYWRERAFKAETQLRALETRVRRLAARATRR